MFPGQQGATCPAQIWPPRLGIKLLEGGPSTEKCAEGRYFRMAPHKIGAISLVIAQSVERAKVVISTLPPLYGIVLLARKGGSETHNLAYKGGLETCATQILCQNVADV